MRHNRTTLLYPPSTLLVVCKTLKILISRTTKTKTKTLEKDRMKQTYTHMLRARDEVSSNCQNIVLLTLNQSN